MLKKSILLALILLLITPGIFITANAEDLPRVKLSEVVHSIFYAPQYVALNLNYFAEEGIEVELSTAWGGDKAAATLMSGNCDIALIGPEPSIYIYQQGAEDYIINFAQLTNTAGSFLLAREPMPDFTWKDVIGKTIIGNRPGGAPQMVLEYVLKNNGIIPGKDVRVITNLDFTANAGAFVGGLGDFVQLFEPNASKLEIHGEGYIVASLGVDGGNVPYTVYMAKKSFLEENPEKVQAFTNAIYRAQIWVENHKPEKIAEVIKSFFPGTDWEVLVKVVTRYKEQGTWDINPVIEKEIFDHYQNIIIEAGELEEKAPYEKLVNNNFAQEAINTVQ